MANKNDNKRKTTEYIIFGGVAVVVVSMLAYLSFREPKSAYDLAVENGFTGTVQEWLESLNGKDGTNGTNGENGSTGSQGEQGAKGDNGVTPQIRVNSENYWEISYDGGTTWTSLNVKATGNNGNDGSTPTVSISDDGYWVINGTKTSTKATGDNGNDGSTPTVSISDDGYWVINDTKTSTKATGDNGNTPQLRVGSANYWEVSYDGGTTWTSLYVKATGDAGANGSSIAEQTITTLNTKLSAIDTNLSSYPTVYQRLNAANITNDNLQRLTRNYLYSYADNKFVCVDDAGYIAFTIAGTSYEYSDSCLSDINLYQFNDSSSLSTDYSNYVVSGTATSITTDMSFDAGENTAITDVTYTTTSSQTANVRLNGGDLTINAPNGIVNHYGSIDHLNIIAVASDSYHEFGTVVTTIVSTGRVVIEDEGSMNSIHLSKTGTSFDDIIIKVSDETEIPTITRDEVGTTIVDPILLCEVENDNEQSDYIYLAVDGTAENIIVATGASTSTGAEAAAYNSEGATSGSSATLNAITRSIISQIANTKNSEDTVEETGLTNAERDLISTCAAKIGNKYYPTLKEACDAAEDNETIEILLGITEDQNANFTTSYVVDKSIVLKGYNCPTIEVDQTLSLFTINDGGSLTIENIIFDAMGRFAATKDGLNSSVGTLYTDTAAANQYTENQRSKPLIVVNAGGTLNVNEDTTFTGFDNSKGISIIKSTGASEKTTTLFIDGAIFKDNIGKQATLISASTYVTCTINDSIISNNVSVQNANHGLIYAVGGCSLVLSGNTKIYGNSYCGNGLISVHGYSTSPSTLAINDNVEIYDNYGGQFSHGYYKENTVTNGRIGLFYVYNYTTVTMNGGYIHDNEIYSAINWGDAYKGAASKIIGMFDINSIDGVVTINGGTIADNYYYDADGTSYEVAVTFDLTNQFSDEDEPYDGRYYSKGDNATVSGYVGNAFPQKKGSTYSFRALERYITDTIEEQNLNK